MNKDLKLELVNLIGRTLSDVQSLYEVMGCDNFDDAIRTILNYGMWIDSACYTTGMGGGKGWIVFHRQKKKE